MSKSKKEEIIDYWVTSDSYANLDQALDIWIKFASYVKPTDLSFMERLDQQELSSISERDLKKYSKIKEQLSIAKKLKKYKKEECTLEEHKACTRFMEQSLKDFVESFFTREQFLEARKFISELVLKEELETYIDFNQKRYDSLTIYEAYLLFQAKEKKYDIETEKSNERIKRVTKERGVNLRRNLIRDYGNIV